MGVESLAKTDSENGRWIKALSDCGKVIAGDQYLEGSAENKLYRIITDHPLKKEEQQKKDRHLFIIDNDPDTLSTAGNNLLEQGKVTKADLERITVVKPEDQISSDHKNKETGMRIIYAPRSILAFRFPIHPTPVS